MTHQPMSDRRRVPAVLFALALAATTAGALSAAGLSAAPARAQVPTSLPVADEVVILSPHARRAVISRRISQDVVRVEGVKVSVAIDQQVASTELAIRVTNPGTTAQQAQFLLPVPDGAIIKSLQYDGTGPEPSGKIYPRDEARRIYDGIVNSMRDPALLEFVGTSLLRTSAFPVPPGQTQTIRIKYEQTLTATDGSVEWLLPRTEAASWSAGAPAYTGDVPWELEGVLTAPLETPIGSVYSSSHEMLIERVAPTLVRLKLPAAALRQAGGIRIGYLLDRSKGTAASHRLRLFREPGATPADGGYFSLLLDLPKVSQASAAAARREITIVLDRSGSMRGDKIRQALAAASDIIKGLNPTDTFRIIDFSSELASFAPQPVPADQKNRDDAVSYLARLQADGGTFIEGALREALSAKPADGEALPIVLFLTDGQPTVGERNETKLRDLAKAANTFNRRVFSVGIGYDVNSPLLTTLARGSRGSPTFIAPDEPLEAKISAVFNRLIGPVFTSPKVAAMGPDAALLSGAIRDVVPGELPDVFQGEQVVIVGRFTTDKPFTLRVSGQFQGQPRSFDIPLDPANATANEPHVARLWAARRIGTLLENLRAQYVDRVIDPVNDPAAKELVDEIVRLSTRFGVLTEYTAFLVTEPNRALSSARELFILQTDNLNRLNRDRAGGLAVAQDASNARLAAAAPAPSATLRATMESRPGSAAGVNLSQGQATYYAARGGQLQEVQLTGVQQINDQAFFRRQNRWIQGNLVATETAQPDRTVTLGTDEYAKLVDDLRALNLGGVLALDGEILISVRNERVLLRNIRD